MKKILIILLVLCFLAASFAGCSEKNSEPTPTTIRISGAWALYPMMLVWADEYMKIAPVEIEVSGGGAGKGMTDVLSNQVDIGMVSRPIKQEELDQGAFYIAATKDTVLGVIHENNPVYEDICEKGLSKENLRKIFMRELTHWGDLFGKELPDDAIVVYGRSDSSGAASVWADYLGQYTEADLQNHSDSNVSGDQAIAAGVQSDKNAISFTNLNYIFNASTGGYVENLRPVPIDLNDNNLIDDTENFYSDKSSFLKNVAAGIYPAPPTRKEYLVGNGVFKGPVLDFIHWILSDGQNILEENGYIKLTDEERNREVLVLSNGSR
ncbi:MAG: substrate-binding domain-containing protein [Clostridia bacterium]|nr:substrate-binding domain-containing protein [Clostridia bacterium]